MAERMRHFRVKWRRLPAGYAAFIDDNLGPPGTVVVIHIILLAGDPNQPVTLLPSRWSQWFAYGGGIWHDRISRRPTTRRRSPSGASTPISAMTCKPGALGAAFAIPRSAMTNRKPALRRWPRSCATGIALEASQRPVSSFRVFILGDPWHTVCSDGLHNTFSKRQGGRGGRGEGGGEGGGGGGGPGEGDLLFLRSLRGGARVFLFGGGGLADPGSRSGSSASGGSKRPKLLGVALLAAQPTAGPFDAPHLRIRHRLPGRIPCGNVSAHTEGAARPSPCCFRRRRRPLRPGYVRCGGAADKTTTMFTGHRRHIPQILMAVRQTMCTRINTTSFIQG